MTPTVFPTQAVLAALQHPAHPAQPELWHSELLSFYRLPRISNVAALAKLDQQAPAWQTGDVALRAGEIVRLVRPLPPQTVALPYTHPLHGQAIAVTAWVIAHVLDHRWPMGTISSYNLEIIPGTEPVFAAREAADMSEETYNGAPAIRGRYLPGWESFRDAEGARDASAAIDRAERKARYDWRHAIPIGPHELTLVQRVTKRTRERRGQALYIDGFLALSARSEVPVTQFAALLVERYGIAVTPDADVSSIGSTLVSLGWSVPGWTYAFGRTWPEENYDLDIDYD